MVKKISNFCVFLIIIAMAENCFINFMEGVNKFSSEDRNEISKSFRDDLKAYKVSGAIMKVVESNSEKVPVYVNVLCQQSRKKKFAEDFDKECSRLRRLYVRTRPEVADKIRFLHEVVMDSLK